jgi:hypothetical protein
MTELDTAIIIAGPLIGTVVGYFLGERREAKRFGKEIAVSPLEHRQLALRDACYALMDYVTSYARKKDGNARTTFLLGDQLDTPLGRVMLWCSEETRKKIVEFVHKSIILANAVSGMSGAPPSQKEEQEFLQAFSSVYVSLAEELGVKILQSQLESIATSLRHSTEG